MTEARIIQNFIGYRAIIISEARAAVAQLELTLERLGLSVVYPTIECGRADIREEWLTGDQAILFVDSDINVAVELPAGEKTSHVPVIGIIGVEAPSRLKALMRLGATATLRKPVHGGSVYAALFVGINELRRRRALMMEVESHERRRLGRRYLVKAILAVMKSTGCNDDQAYDKLRRESMRQRLSLEDYCESFIRALPDANEPQSTVQGKIRAE